MAPEEASVTKTPPRTTLLILGAVLAMSAAIAAWFQYAHQQKMKAETRQSMRPLALPSANTPVTMIRIKGPKGLIELKCASVADKTCTMSSLGAWTVGTDPADARIVNHFLKEAYDEVGVVVDLSTETPEKKKAQWQEYGLADPVSAPFIELTLLDEKGVSSQLTEWFGGADITGAATFVGVGVDGKLTEDKAFLVYNRFKDAAFSVTADQFRVQSPKK